MQEDDVEREYRLSGGDLEREIKKRGSDKNHYW